MKILKRIEVVFEPVEKMRYATVGDYFPKKDGTLRFEIADLGDTFFNKMILIHEMVEQALTEKFGITNEHIDKFDFMFEKEVNEGRHLPGAEAGSDVRCPYHREHTLATAVEMMMCALTGVKWNEYNSRVNNL